VAQLTITVPDTLAPRVLAAIRTAMPETVGMTDADAAKHFIRHHVRAVVAQHEQRAAAELARAAALVARDKAWTDTEIIT
jgi:hypothetical protein